MRDILRPLPEPPDLVLTGESPTFSLAPARLCFSDEDLVDLSPVFSAAARSLLPDLTRGAALDESLVPERSLNRLSLLSRPSFSLSCSAACLASSGSALGITWKKKRKHSNKLLTSLPLVGGHVFVTSLPLLRAPLYCLHVTQHFRWNFISCASSISPAHNLGCVVVKTSYKTCPSIRRFVQSATDDSQSMRPHGKKASFRGVMFWWASLQVSQAWIRRNPFTPKGDQCQISPAASPQILHHTVWRTWLFITYSDERWLY